MPVADLDRMPFDLTGFTCYPTAAAMLRWGIEGRRGVFLDVLFCRRRVAWVTSAEALARFAADTEAAFWAAYAAERATPTTASVTETTHAA
ncbi:hypothetical protein J0H58_09675 [bacterium]|nr:hypothetical protein [bacterium]